MEAQDLSIIVCILAVVDLLETVGLLADVSVLMLVCYLVFAGPSLHRLVHYYLLERKLI